MNLRLARPGVLVDINRVAALDGIRRNGGLTIGATARHAAILRSSDVQAVAPMIGEAVRLIGHPGIRSRGTFGGSIAHADAAAELPAVLLALGGEVTVQGPSGERTIAADDLFVTAFTTSIADNEILTSVRIPAPAPNARWAFHEVARRHGDFALVGVAATAELDDSGYVRRARIGLLGVADRPVRAGAAEQALVGRTLADGAAEAGGLAARDLDPPADVHGSSSYRKQAAEALVRRALTTMSTQGGSR
jgi:CO/xanthine dehydrogenase FAD-binding subunit